MTAADILRERARQTENVSSAAFAPTSPDLLRATADLMEACLLRSGNTTWCLMCDSILPHSYKCPLAALERLITKGERDADR